MRARRRRCTPGRLHQGTEEQAGFSLLEVVVALFTLTFVATATAWFFIGAVRTTADQSDKQSALALATQGLEAVKALPATTAVTGRTRAAVQDLNDVLGGLVAQDVVDTDNFDPNATVAAGPLVPLSRTQDLKGTAFTVRTAVNRCWLSQTTHACTRTQPADAVEVYRATVNVTWRQPDCGPRCSYTTSALIDRQDDPLFDVATSQPILVTATPDSTSAGTSTQVTLSGVSLVNGATLVAGTGGGTFTTASRVGTDGRKLTTTWRAGNAPGLYTLLLTNPDSGEAVYSPLQITPLAVSDCTRTLSNGYYVSPVLANDVPSGQGTVTITSAPSAGDAQVVDLGGTTYVAYRPDPSDTATSFFVGYTTTVNDQVSGPATVTVKTQGKC